MAGVARRGGVRSGGAGYCTARRHRADGKGES